MELNCIGPVIIVGSQRSGTTLLRLILNAHSNIAIPGEATFLMPLLKKKYLSKPISGDKLNAIVNYLRANQKYMYWNYDSSHFLSSIVAKGSTSLRDLIGGMFSGYSESQGKKIWGDKSLTFLRKIEIVYSLFPSAKFVHVVRDGRDVFNSWRRLDPKREDVTLMALEWRYKLFRIERSFDKLPAIAKTTIRYEDLLTEPDKTLRSLCSFIGVEYESDMMNFYRTSPKYIGERHSDLIFKPLNTGNLYKWRKSLTPKEIRIFQSIAGIYLKKYNYEIDESGLRLSDMPVIARSFTVNLPKRIVVVLNTKRRLENAVARGNHVEIPGEPPKAIQEQLTNNEKKA